MTENGKPQNPINPYTGKPYKTITKIETIEEFVENRIKEPGGLSAIKAVLQACLDAQQKANESEAVQDASKTA